MFRKMLTFSVLLEIMKKLFKTHEAQRHYFKDVTSSVIKCVKMDYIFIPLSSWLLYTSEIKNHLISIKHVMGYICWILYLFIKSILHL